jgi:flagellar protein FliL
VKKWMIPMIGLLAAVGVAGAGIALGWFSFPGLSKVTPARAEKETMGPIVKLSPLIINLKDESGRSYVKTTIALEVCAKDRFEEVTRRISQLTDLVILTLGDKRLADLKGLESKENLKQELLSKMNQQFSSKTIKSLYFDEFLYE